MGRRTRANLAFQLAECQAALAISVHRRDAARAELLMHLEAQIIGNVVRDGRDALRLLVRRVGDLYSWDGHVLYHAFLFVAAVTGPCPPLSSWLPWADSELLAVAEHAGISVVDLFAYLDHAVPAHVFRSKLAAFAVWMRHQ